MATDLRDIFVRIRVDADAAINETRRMEHRLSRLEREFGSAERGARRFGRNTTKAIQPAAKSIRGLESSIKNLRGGFGAGGLASALGVGLLARQFTRAADAATRTRAQLQLVTRNAADLANAQRTVFRLAQQTRGEYETMGKLYASVARSAKDLTNAERARVTFAIGAAGTISGGGVAVDQANRQLIQALDSNRLGGEELRSVMEQNNRLARAIADGMGKQVGELRNLSKANLLTGDVIRKALLSQADILETELKTAPITFEAIPGLIRTELAEALKDVTIDKASIKSLAELTGKAVGTVLEHPIATLTTAILGGGALSAGGSLLSRGIDYNIARGASLKGARGRDVSAVLGITGGGRGGGVTTPATRAAAREAERFRTKDYPSFFKGVIPEFFRESLSTGGLARAGTAAIPVAVVSISATAAAYLVGQGAAEPVVQDFKRLGQYFDFLQSHFTIRPERTPGTTPEDAARIARDYSTAQKNARDEEIASNRLRNRPYPEQTSGEILSSILRANNRSLAEYWQTRTWASVRADIEKARAEGAEFSRTIGPTRAIRDERWNEMQDQIARSRGIGPGREEYQAQQLANRRAQGAWVTALADHPVENITLPPNMTEMVQALSRNFFGTLNQTLTSAIASGNFENVGRALVSSLQASLVSSLLNMGFQALANRFPGLSSYLPVAGSFHNGGVVPGRSGRESLALVQGKERIYPEGKGPADGGGVFLTVNNIGDVDPAVARSNARSARYLVRDYRAQQMRYA